MNRLLWKSEVTVKQGTIHYSDPGCSQDTRGRAVPEWKQKIWTWEAQHVIHGHTAVWFITEAEHFSLHLMKNKKNKHSCPWRGHKTCLGAGCSLYQNVLLWIIKTFLSKFLGFSTFNQLGYWCCAICLKCCIAFIYTSHREKQRKRKREKGGKVIASERDVEQQLIWHLPLTFLSPSMCNIQHSVLDVAL